MSNLKTSLLKVDTGSELTTRRMPWMYWDSGKPGPKIWLTGCMHGDEIGGTVVIQEVFNRLQQHPLICGSLHAFPMLNPTGFEQGKRHVPVSREDLNRTFPGDQHGTLAERMAYQIFNTISQAKPDLVLDLHNDWRRSVCYALVDPEPGPKAAAAYAATRRAAGFTGLPVVRDTPQSYAPGMISRTFSYNLLKNGIAAVTLELGEGAAIDEISVRDGVMAVWNVLTNLGLVPAMENRISYEVPAPFKRRVLRYSDRPHASVSGIIRYRVEPGQVVLAGTVIAEVYNAFGQTIETLVSGAKGIVLGQADSSVTFPGMNLIGLAVIETDSKGQPTDIDPTAAATEPSTTHPAS